MSRTSTFLLACTEFRLVPYSPCTWFKNTRFNIHTQSSLHSVTFTDTTLFHDGKVSPSVLLFKVFLEISGELCTFWHKYEIFGTLIVVTNTSIFRYSDKRELRWLPQLIKVHEHSMKFIFPSLSRHSIIIVSDNKVYFKVY